MIIVVRGFYDLVGVRFVLDVGGCCHPLGYLFRAVNVVTA